MPNVCQVTGRFLSPTGGAIPGVVVTVESEKAFQHGNEIVMPFQSSVISDEDGDFSINVVETETVEETVDFTAEYSGEHGSFRRKFPGVTIPDVPATGFADIVEL